MIRQYYEQGAHVVLVDMGNSYQGLCELIREKRTARTAYILPIPNNVRSRSIRFIPQTELMTSKKRKVSRC